jgi:hypothetical protein
MLALLLFTAEHRFGAEALPSQGVRPAARSNALGRSSPAVVREASSERQGLKVEVLFTGSFAQEFA